MKQNMDPQIPLNPTPEQPKKNWFLRHEVLYSVIGVLLLVVILGSMAWWKIIKNTPSNQAAVAPTNNDVTRTETQFTIEGTQIYKITSQGKQLLFTNVKNVSEVRLGPDGNTIHFKFDGGNANQARCANLATKVTPAGSNYPNPPPSQAPWDYSRVASYGTINGCGEYGQSGGYVPNTNYFAYLKIDSLGATSLILEDSMTKKVEDFPIDSKIWTQVASASQGSVGGFQDNGTTYYYPKDSIFVANGKLFIAIGRMTVAIDLAKNNLLGIELLIAPKYSIVADSFWFHSNSNSPLILMESGWEGGSSFNAVFDLSGDKLQVIGLDKYPQPSSGYQTPLFEWKQQVLLLHFYKETDITNQISKQDLAFFEDMSQSSDLQDSKNNEIQAKLMATGEYIEVRCELPPGMGPSGCWAITKGLDYQIIPGRGISVFK